MFVSRFGSFGKDKPEKEKEKDIKEEKVKDKDKDKGSKSKKDKERARMGSSGSIDSHPAPRLSMAPDLSGTYNSYFITCTIIFNS